MQTNNLWCFDMSNDVQNVDMRNRLHMKFEWRIKEVKANANDGFQLGLS